MSERCESLFERLAAATDESEAGSVAYQLLNCLYQTADRVQDLEPLIDAEDIVVRSKAAWIASELGDEGRVLYDPMMRLLRRSSERDRLWVVMFLSLHEQSLADGDLVTVSDLLLDDDPSMSEMVLSFLGKVPLARLQAAESKFVEGARVLLSLYCRYVASAADSEIAEGLLSRDSLVRHVAAASALRVNRLELLEPELVAVDGTIERLAEGGLLGRPLRPDG